MLKVNSGVYCVLCTMSIVSRSITTLFAINHVRIVTYLFILFIQLNEVTLFEIEGLDATTSLERASLRSNSEFQSKPFTISLD